MELRINVPPPQLPSTTQAAEVKESHATTGAKEDPKLRQASDDFAAVLFSQMFAEMRPKPGEDGESLFGGEQDTELFMDMFDMSIGQKYVASGNPIADQLYQQLIGKKSPGSQS
jgi:Rod binding domain-containing protein